MRPTRLFIAILSVVVCGLFAFSVGLQAQSSMRLGKAMPLNDVRKFHSEFTARLNQSISAAPSARTGWIAGHKVYKGFIDYFLIKTDTKAAATTLVKLSDADLKQLGTLVNHRFEEAIRTKNTSSLGDGKIDADFFKGKLLPVPGSSNKLSD